MPVMLPPPSNPLRLVGWAIVTHRYFDSIILVCIAINCFFMAIEDPVEAGNLLYFDIAYDTSLLISRILLWVFTIEALMKNLAFTPWGYLSGPDQAWNRLDFIIVVFGWLEEYPDFFKTMPFNIGFLRIFRVFRPLRTLGKMGSMKELISTLWICFDPLVDVMYLTIFVFFVFSVLGMELFRGQGSQRCILKGPTFDDDYPKTSDWTILPDDYTLPIEGRTCGGNFQCPTIDLGNGTRHVYECYHLGRNADQGILKQNQADGIIGYDNVGQAMLTVFVFCTLEGWVDGMYQFQDSFGWGVSTAYHVLLVLLGTFFCMNLALAVIADTFESAAEEAAAEEEEEEEEEKKKKINKNRAEERKAAAIEGDERKGAAAEDEEGRSEGEGEDALEEEARAPKPTNVVLCALWTVSYNASFNNFITLLILLNAITLALEHSRISCLPVTLMDDASASASASASANHDDEAWSAGGWAGPVPECIHQADTMSDEMAKFLVNTNYVFVVAFAVECFVKMGGLSPRHYFRDAFNSFDFLIVVVSFLEIAIRIKGLTALRCFRLARVFKMARSWGSLRAIIQSLLKALPAMTSLTVMLALYMFIAAVAGMQMLGPFIPYDSRSRFTDFGIALLTVFQMLTGENWNEVMFESITSTGGYAIVLYFVLIVLVGMFLVLNLFLAIMLSDFNCGEPPDFSISTAIKTFFPFSVTKEAETKKEEAAGGKDNNDDEIDDDDDDDDGDDEDEAAPTPAAAGDDATLRQKRELEQRGKHGSAEMVAIQKDLERSKRASAAAERMQLRGVSLGLFPTDSPVRLALMRVVRNPYFDHLILACILTGSVLLAVNGPTNDGDTRVWRYVCYVEFAFVIIFTVEMLFKILVQGFYFCPQGYLKDPWNMLDLVVVVVGWLTNDCLVVIPFGAEGVSALRTLRVLRVLRPLRVVQRMPGMRLVVMVLFECTPVFINICFVVFFFFAVFAIMGVQFFKGIFWYCNDGDVVDVDQCWGCFADEEGGNPHPLCPEGSSRRVWRNAKMNFDNTMNSLLTLYEVAGLEMWLDVMYSAMDGGSCARDARGVKDFPFGCQPQQEENATAAWFFVLFILVGVFIVMNLFVGAVVDKFNELKEANGGGALLKTEEQQQYCESIRLMARMRPFRVHLPPVRPDEHEGCRAWGLCVYHGRMACYRTVMWDTSGRGMGTTFDTLISLIVMLNILVMGMYYWKRLDAGVVMQLEANCVAMGDAKCDITEHQVFKIKEK